LALTVFIVSSIYLLKGLSTQSEVDNSSLLASLNHQADQLLLGGQPGPASEIIEKIKTIDPEYINLPELSERANELLQFEVKYLNALRLINVGDNNEALKILNEIESDQSGLWDITQRIASLEKKKQIDEYLNQGDTAYQDEDWDAVITAYENVLQLDQSINDPVMKEQLLFSYLNRIIFLLQSESSSIEDLDKAEQYYRRALALFPQSKEFANQRGNLQEVSSNLLEVKFTQIAKTNLADKNQTGSSVSEAVSYLRKALQLNPTNAALQSDLKNAEVYQIAFQNFINMDMVQAVTNFNIVINEDRHFANGNASTLLYEAYYALGKQYLNAGIYLDARSNLEQAEILAWSDQENLMKLFQVQILLGDTLGKLDDYQNAVSYYQYALNAIKAQNKLLFFTDLSNQYAEANFLAVIGDYRGAFKIYQEIIKQIDAVYTNSEVEISSGACLALFANENSSTVDAILKANNLPRNMVISFGRILIVPSISN